MVVTDAFTDRVANLSGETIRLLEHIAKLLDEEGFVAEVAMCETFLEKHKKLSYDCAVVTQKIEGELDDSPNES